MCLRLYSRGLASFYHCVGAIMNTIETFIVTFGTSFLVSFFFITYLKHLKIKREIAEIDDLIAAISRENAAIKREMAAIDDRFTGGKV